MGAGVTPFAFVTAPLESPAGAPVLRAALKGDDVRPSPRAAICVSVWRVCVVVVVSEWF